MTFSEFFNPYDLDHILAFDTVQQTGSWPKDFIPENIQGQPQYFTIEAAGLLAQAYVKQAKEDNHFRESYLGKYN
jgi:hypothetical protein